MYVTGGIGSTVIGESFTLDYDLPNDTKYCETCAAIGLVFFYVNPLEVVPFKEQERSDKESCQAGATAMAGLCLLSTKSRKNGNIC